MRERILPDVSKPCLYGTRDAAMNWQECVAEYLTKIGFQRGRAYRGLYYNKEKKLYTLIHGDDYVSVGGESELQWLKEQLESSFEIITDMLGRSDPDLTPKGNLLNRVFRVDESGWKLGAGPRHAELSMEELGIRDSKGFTNPRVDERDADKPEKSFEEQRATRYRSLVPRANCLATDRPDLSFAVK